MRKSDPDTRTQKSRRARARALRYVSDGEPGIRRRRVGRGFAYLDADGKRVHDEATLARIRALAIPPAYADVWICAMRRNTGACCDSRNGCLPCARGCAAIAASTACRATRYSR